MTNLDKWRFYNSGLFSPDHFIDWGWYSMIAAALERRVFYDNSDHPLFPCMYTVLIAPAGVGKGLVIDEVIDFIKFHKAPKQPMSAVRQAVERAVGSNPDPTLFGIGADSTTYESLLVETVAASETLVKPNGEAEMQAAIYFLLDEYTSIFKEHSSDLVTFLLTAWNGKNYTRKTKNKGHDYIKNPCINILAGTTPSEFAKVLRKEVIGSGIMARTILVYGHKNRSRGIKLPAPTLEQRAAKTEILAWLYKLKHVYQCVKYSTEAEEYLIEWYADEARVRVNPNQKLDEYYVRKITHIHKLTMAMHFSEPGYERPVPVETIKAAIGLLNMTEVDMHLALTAGGRNELSPIANAIARYIQRYPGGVTYPELVVQFISDANGDELNEIVRSLQVQGIIVNDAKTQKYMAMK